MSRKAEFDEFARNYEETLARPCALSGESPDFYAAERLHWCVKRLQGLTSFDRVLDFGCGVGGSIPLFFSILHAKTVIGVDPSAESLEVARERHTGYDVRLMKPEEFVPSGDIPFGFCNGVFHHIPPAQRMEALAYIRGCLSKDGILAFWENNPWNPVVVYSMSLNEFDRNAQRISPRAARRVLKKAGFRVEFVDFCFFFPRFARKLRGLEPWLRRCFLGAQYLVVARK